jgi:hypothetical protein
MKLDHTSKKELIKKAMSLATKKEKQEYSALVTGISSIRERLQEINVESEKLVYESRTYGSVVAMSDETFSKWSINTSKTIELVKEYVTLKVALADLLDKEKWLLLSVALKHR